MLVQFFRILQTYWTNFERQMKTKKSFLRMYTVTRFPTSVERNRFPRASAILWRTLEEWIVDHYVTQYNQRLDEWMNAHTRQ